MTIITKIKKAIAQKHGIKFVTPEAAQNIVMKRTPTGKFYTVEGGLYVGIDNSHGEAWTEDFNNFRICVRWLADEELTMEEIRK
jgi:hypothetical protein